MNDERDDFASAIRRPPARRPGRPANHLTAADVHRAAAEIIAEKGYAATSLRDIAEALDIRKATVHHHIGSKQELLFSIIEGYQRIGKGIMAEVDECSGDVSERFGLLLERHVWHVVADQTMARLLSRELRSLEPPYSDHALETRRVYQDYVTDLIREGQRAGAFKRDIAASLASTGILVMLNNVHDWHGGVADPPEALATMFKKLMLTGLEA